MFVALTTDQEMLDTDGSAIRHVLGFHGSSLRTVGL
jgi:hypothetical protein